MTNEAIAILFTIAVYSFLGVSVHEHPPKDLEYNFGMTNGVVINEKDLPKRPEENDLEREDHQNLAKGIG